MIRKILLALALAFVAWAPTSAQAYWPYLGYGGYGGYGNGWGFNQATNYVPSPPYYAIYPPVYYSSQITARHYGASPFAWSPGMQPITYTAEPASVAAPEPLIIENPYVTGAKSNVKQASVTQPSTDQSSPSEAVVEPLKIDNPFFVGTSR